MFVRDDGGNFIAAMKCREQLVIESYEVEALLSVIVGLSAEELELH